VPTSHAEFKPVKPLPLTVITVPGAPEAGEKLVIVGTPAIAGSDEPARDTANTHQLATFEFIIANLQSIEPKKAGTSVSEKSKTLRASPV
jgi:hypothetical protein